MNVLAGTDGPDHRRSEASLLQHQHIEAQLHILLKLSRALRRTGTVPQSGQTSLNTCSSRSSRPRSSAASTPGPSGTSNCRGEQFIPRRDDNAVPPGLPITPSAQDIPGPSKVPSRTHSQTRSSPAAPSSRAVSREGSEAGPSQALVRLRSPSIGSEDNFIGVHSGEAFRVVASPAEWVEHGHIKYKDGEKIAVLARIKPDQAFNFMTTFRASELGLLEVAQPHEDGDQETWILLPDGTRIQPHGTIQLRWYPRQSRPIPLQFLVLPRWSEAEIVLGAQYVAKEEHYAKRRRDRK